MYRHSYAKAYPVERKELMKPDRPFEREKKSPAALTMGDKNVKAKKTIRQKVYNIKKTRKRTTQRLGKERQVK